jgi:hypothetical protein
MAREQITFSFNYEDLAELTDMSVDGIRQARSRNEFDPTDIASVFVWLGRKGTRELRLAMHEFGWHDTSANPWTNQPRRRSPKKTTKTEK